LNEITWYRGNKLRWVKKIEKKEILESLKYQERGTEQVGGGVGESVNSAENSVVTLI